MRSIFLLLLTTVALCANAQTADEVIGKFNSNAGGLDNFKKVKTAKLTGTVMAQGNELPLTVQLINGRATRSDVEIEQMASTITSAYKDGKGWRINPFNGGPDATDVSGNELEDLKQQSYLASGLMDYKERNNKVELLGQEDVNGTKAFKIKVTSSVDARSTIYFISTTDYSLLKTVASREMMGQTTDVETYFSDPKTINGLKFYMSRSLMVNGQEVQGFKFEKVDFDVPIDEKIFDKP